MNYIFYKEYSSIKIKELTKVTISAVFIIIGILLPLFTSHIIGVPGTTFLPMHIPVLLCGAICGLKYGLFCGLITPVLSCLLTGMPNAFPMLPIMIVELTVYGLTIGFLVEKIKLNIIISLVITMVIGRLFYALMFTILTSVTGENLQALSVIAAFIAGIPGIMIQLVIVPVIYQTLRINILNEHLKLDKNIREAIEMIENDEYKLIIMKHKKIIYKSNESGVKSLFNLYNENKKVLKGSLVIDKVTGKASATILTKAKAKGLYTLLLSKEAIPLLSKSLIKYDYKEDTDYIMNRDRNGMCPIEKTILNETDLDVSVELIRKKLIELGGMNNVPGRQQKI